MSGPTFLVVGGARCGTTALAEGLRAHPRVFVTTPKEPHYFAFHRIGAHFTAPGDDRSINRAAVTDREAYLRLYPAEPHEFLALGDASVSTMYYHEEALPEILRMNPEMKLVALLREPVERAYSAHQYMRARGLEPVEDLVEAVALEEERRAAGWHHIWHYTAMSRYAPAVAAMQAAVPADQLGIWFYDDLNRDYAATMREILGFLGVPPTDAEAGVPRVNISGRSRYPRTHAAIRWATRRSAVRFVMRRATSFRLREAVRSRFLTSDALPPHARAALTPLFEDDLAALRTLLPAPGPQWLHPSAPPAEGARAPA
jgi:Sulfotransferase family